MNELIAEQFEVLSASDGGLSIEGPPFIFKVNN
jgi:hypothetical protein